MNGHCRYHLLHIVCCRKYMQVKVSRTSYAELCANGEKSAVFVVTSIHWSCPWQIGMCRKPHWTGLDFVPQNHGMLEQSMQAASTNGREISAMLSAVWSHTEQKDLRESQVRWAPSTSWHLQWPSCVTAHARKRLGDHPELKHHQHHSQSKRGQRVCVAHMQLLSFNMVPPSEAVAHPNAWLCHQDADPKEFTSHTRFEGPALLVLMPTTSVSAFLGLCLLMDLSKIMTCLATFKFNCQMPEASFVFNWLYSNRVSSRGR